MTKKQSEAFKTLSPCELEVLTRWVRGETLAESAAKISAARKNTVSKNTVNKQRQAIKSKLDTTKRSEIFKIGIESGVLNV